MFLTRLASALVYAALFLGSAYLGGIWLSLFAGLVYIIALLEFLSMSAKTGSNPHSAGLMVTGLALLAAATFWGESAVLLGFGLMIPLLLGLRLVRGPQGSWHDAGATAFAFAYLALPLSLLILLGQFGFSYVLGALAITWASDAVAYIIGSLIGRHKLAPAVSPSKSVEGSVAGLLAAVLVGYLWSLIFKRPPLPGLVLGLLSGLACQAGDLFESCLKRDAGVKDSGSLIPGHGGVLDRFDSLFFVVPAFYALTRLWLLP